MLDSKPLKEKVLLPVEWELGRRRSENKFAPRTMDIDIVLFDDVSCDDKYWEQAFVVVPLAEIYPTFRNPVTRETTLETASRLRSHFWMEVRPGVLSHLDSSGPVS
jgi:7,8-dihydro-6-hydroxymethylpterin-pyrophosphokinase